MKKIKTYEHGEISTHNPDTCKACNDWENDRKVCQRCGKKWNYTGKATYYTSCPNCKTSVSVRKKQEVD